MSTPLGPMLDPAERALLDRRRRRVLRLLASSLVLPLLVVLIAWAGEQFGEDLPANASYRWSGSTILVRSATDAECRLTPPQPEEVRFVHADRSPFAVDGVDIGGSPAGETTLTCDSPVTITSGVARLVTYPARFTSALLLVWPLLGLWTLIEALLLIRRRLRVGDLRIGR